MKATINSVSDTKTGIISGASQPYVLKNQSHEITSIEQIRDVYVIEEITGSTLIYNSDTKRYEVKQLELSNLDLSGSLGNLDGGTF